MAFWTCIVIYVSVSSWWFVNGLPHFSKWDRTKERKFSESTKKNLKKGYRRRPEISSIVSIFYHAFIFLCSTWIHWSYSSFCIVVSNHRTVKWLGLEGTPRIIEFQPPCHRMVGIFYILHIVETSIHCTNQVKTDSSFTWLYFAMEIISK